MEVDLLLMVIIIFSIVTIHTSCNRDLDLKHYYYYKCYYNFIIMVYFLNLYFHHKSADYFEDVIINWYYFVCFH